MTRALLFCASLLMLGSCTQKLVCPAYQSAFIFDKPSEKEKFVYYNDHPTSPREVLASSDNKIILPARDSLWKKSDAMKGPALPHVRRVKKDRYLLLPEKSYKKALKALRTVEMKPVYPKKVEDSTAIKDALDSAARSITDTLTAQAPNQQKQTEDSVYAITKTKERYNADQDIYMWYLRDILVLPDVRAAMQDNEQQQKASTKEKKTKKGVGGFFQNLFKKKKNKSDSASLLSNANEADSLQTAQPKKEKKGIKGLFKKKDKSVDSKDPKKPDPAKKEDDGF